MNRIPTLDGWRGIAILLVMITHLQAGLLGHLYSGYGWLDLGLHGVEIFFVLSGYLITAHLLEEEKIHLKRFYLRRFFRLMPAAWAYLLFVFLLGMASGVRTIGSDVWSCLLFYRNYFPSMETSSNTLTLHYWSLSLEEQFYLIWPPILVLVGRRWALVVASAGAIGCAAFRFFHWASYESGFRYLRTEVRADALLAGCILALLLDYPVIRAWLVNHGSNIFWFCIPPLAWDFFRYHHLLPLNESLLIAAMIACTSLHPASIPSRMLEWQHLKFTGIMSYSFYIWQNIFLRSNWGPFGFLLLAIFAFGSWKLIEKPGIAFGRRREAIS